MPHPMTSTGIWVKNRISSADAWLILIQIDATALEGSTYRRTSDETTTMWLGLAYSPIAMSFGEVQENLQGGLPRIDMRLSNLDTIINTAMNLYDGLRCAIVTVYIIPSGSLPSGSAELIEVFEVIETSADNQWITFTLGYADPLGKRFPRDRYTATSCRHIFNNPKGSPPVVGTFCRYVGALTTCDHTLVHCQARDNRAQFGGSPGVDEGIYQ